ncbi:MAG: hypothetical protein IJO24_05195 [Clostridia bacterium]|nr:hypothetical protein [Clostridia bacterium]
MDEKTLSENEEVTKNESITENDRPIVQEKQPNKKKKTIVVIVSVLLFVLLSVFVSIFTNPVRKTEILINAIGVVSLDSETKIKKAEEAYNKLSDEDKEKLTNEDILDKCRTSYKKITAAYNAINNLGSISLDSESEVVKARSSFADCSDEEKKQVTNLAVLEDAEKRLSELKVQEVMTAIENLGEINLESGSRIQNVRKLYEELLPNEKELVTNISVLEQAETKFNGLQIKEVEKAIKDIGKVTLKKEKVIEKAEDLYNGLSFEQQKSVSNAKTLTKARTTYAKLVRKENKNRAKEAFKKMKSEYDKVEEITWYFPKTFPDYIDIRSYVLPYIAIDDEGRIRMRLRYNYTGDDWIFWEEAIIKIDDEKYYENAGNSGTVRDNDTEVWEYYDVVATETEIEMLEKIVESKETIVRFDGDNHHYDLTISSSDKKAIKEILEAYKYATYLD